MIEMNTLGGKKPAKPGSFSSWNTNVTKRFRDLFAERYNDDHQALLVSKKAFRHDAPEDGLVFGYRYVVQVTDVLGLAGEPVNDTGEKDISTITVNLYLIPEPEYWCREALIEAARTCGRENEPLESIKKVLGAQDAINNNNAVLIGQDSVLYNCRRNPDGYYDPLRNRAVVRMADTIATLMETMDRMRGFMIDGLQNRLGTTGWDVLEATIHGGDSIAMAMDRWKGKHMAEA